MLLLLIIPIWAFLIAIVAGLCASARTGDAPLADHAPSERGVAAPPPAIAARQDTQRRSAGAPHELAA